MIVFINNIVNLVQKSPILLTCSEVIFIISIATVTHFITNKCVKHLPSLCLRYYSKIDSRILDFILIAIKEPLIFFVWTISCIIIIEVVATRSLFAFKSFILILTLTWLIIRLLAEGEKYLINFVYVGDQKIYRRNKTSVIAVNRMLKVILVIIATLLTLQEFNINITGIVALGGAGTLVLGLAAKELLANFFGGMMIFMDRQFIVGDSIKATSQGIEGKVEYIGWRLTRIRTLENSLLYVPNSAFLTMSVENSSKRYTRRIKEIIRFKYKDLSKIEVILQELQEVLKNDPNLDPNQMCFLGIYQFSYLAVDCLLNCFTKATDLEDYLKVQHNILYKISSVLIKHEVEIAFTSLAENYHPSASSAQPSLTGKE